MKKEKDQTLSPDSRSVGGATLSLLLTAVLGLSACGGGTPQEKAAAPTSSVETKQQVRADGITYEVSRAVSLNPDLSNQESFKANLNKYTVKISVPTELLGGLTMTRVQKYSQRRQKFNQSFFTYGEAISVFTETLKLEGPVLEKQLFTYELRHGDQNLEPIEFAVKPDLLVQGEVSLHGLYFAANRLDLGALYLDDQAVLVTEGEDVVITAGTFVSNNARILTLRDEEAQTPAQDYLPGKDGSAIVIQTDFFTGHLEFKLQGQTGGAGADGLPAPPPPPKAANGYDSGGSICEANIFSLEVLRVQREPRQCFWRCSSYPTNGQPGLKGYPGNDGSPGAKGGATGYVQFTALKAFAHYVTLVQAPGVGGEPGKGSKGSAGGEGGNAGAVRDSRCNNKPQNGPPGPEGDPGRDGSVGEPGETQRSTIIINGTAY